MPKIFRSKLDLRRLLSLFADREVLLHLGIGIEDRGNPAAWDRAKCRVVGLPRVNVIAARDCDTILSSFELGLKRHEILVRLQIGIALADGEESPQRVAEL